MSKTEVLHVRMDEWMKDDLRAYATEVGMPVTSVLESAIEEYLRTRYGRSRASKQVSGAEKLDPNAFDEMSEDRKTALLGWIAGKLEPATKYPEWPSAYDSYSLKHIAARDIGYVTSGEFKGAMLASGYLPMYYDECSWRFKVRGKRENPRT